jgi:hypothetical protein
MKRNKGQTDEWKENMEGSHPYKRSIISKQMDGWKEIKGKPNEWKENKDTFNRVWDFWLYEQRVGNEVESG